VSSCAESAVGAGATPPPPPGPTPPSRQQSVNYGTRIFTETVDRLDLGAGPPFTLHTGTKEVTASAVIIATGAAAR